MKKTLGFDLGSNSLGWAVLDDITGDILDKGVVVFPEGIEPEDKLETPAAKRRVARMGRRLKFRRKIRKWALLRILIDNGMCPMSSAELDEWKRSGKYPIENAAFINWLMSTDVSNPYADRAAAAAGKVDPLVLGRALYHICQRRGFKSSRKDSATTGDETDGQSKKTKTKDDKDLGAVKQGIADLDAELKKSGCKTLGAYFAKLIDEQKQSPEKIHIRKRYTDRIRHYEAEFKVIMEAQGIPLVPCKDKNDPKCLYEQLHDAIFYQRPLRSQKHLVGMCPLEPKSPRCRISHPAYEEFRMLSFVNNLSFEDANGNWKDDDGKLLYPLTQDERMLALGAFDKITATFGDIIKRFAYDPKKDKKDEAKRNYRYNTQHLKFHYYSEHEKDALPVCETHLRIKKAFGSVAYDEQKVFDALCFFDDDEKLAKWVAKHYPISSKDQIAMLAKINPKEGHAKYSLKAINKILPYLRQGMQLFDAQCAAKLHDLVPDLNDEQIRVLIAETKEEHRRIYEDIRAERWPKGKPVPRLIDCYERRLQENHGVSDKTLEGFRRYFRGDSIYQPETWYWKNKGKGEKAATPMPRLPKVELGMIRNPLVQRSMTILRRLVNYLAGQGKIDFSDTIRIELARGVNDYATRHAIQNWQKMRQKKRDEAVVEMSKLGIVPSDDAIERYVLWDEQGKICPYTGISIGVADLFDGNKFDIEHTIPRSRSGDDSLANKTLCDAHYNREVKKGAIPTECPNWDREMAACNNIISTSSPLRAWRNRIAELEKVYQRQKKAARGSDPKKNVRIKMLEIGLELKYWKDKVKRFEITEGDLAKAEKDGGLGGFKKRQLVDTGIMCSHAVDLLRCLYPKTYAVNGTATAFARKAWGVQTDEAKDRTSHTHHAKDAMVIAALTPARFNAICTALKDDGEAVRGRECDICKPPYEDFAEKVRKACDEILVKHVLRQTTLKPSSKRNCLAKAHRQKDDPSKMVRAVLSKGDTVRGRLHMDHFYGCIVDPAEGKKKFVVRKSLIGKIEGDTGVEKTIPKIVDKRIREIVSDAVEKLKREGKKNVETGDIKMPSGVPINKARIFAKPTNPSVLRQHTMASDKDYKTPYYVTSAEGSNFRLALYCVDGKYSVEPDNSLDWVKAHKMKPNRKAVTYTEPDGFVGYIMPDSMALTYRETPEELKTLRPAELVKRLYKVVKFNSNTSVSTTFRHHVEARDSTELEKDMQAIGKNKKGMSKIDFDNPHELLLMSASKYLPHMLFEGIHFKMMLDGSIEFLI